MLMDKKRLEKLKETILICLLSFSKVLDLKYFEGFNRAELSIAVEELLKKERIRFIKEDEFGIHYEVIK